MALKMTKSSRSTTSRKDGSPYKGGSILWNVCSFILITELCERMAFYTFQGTIVTFMTSELGVTGLFASQMTSLFSAFVALTPVLGGLIADEYLGRYTTIVIFINIYIIGLALCSAAAYPDVLNTALFLTGLLLFISLGAGGIKANVVTLGGDQFDETKPEEEKERTQFFNYFYWAINIGSLIANGYFSNLAFNPEVFSGGLVPTDMGYFTSYIIPLCVLVVCFLIFLSGTPRYVRNPPAGDVTSSFMKEVKHALLEGGHWKGKLVFWNTIALFLGALLIIISFFVEDNASFGISIVGMIIILACCAIYAVVCRDLSWFGYINEDPLSQKVVSRAAHTYNVKDMLYISPYWGMLVMFWVCYNQMYTNFAVQGCQMNYLFGDVIFAPAFFSLFDSLVIIIVLPIIDGCLYPAMEKKIGRQLKPLEKMSMGFFMVTIAMFVAGFIETGRRNSADAALAAGFPQNLNPNSTSKTGVQQCCVITTSGQESNCFWAAEGSNCQSIQFCGDEMVESTITPGKLLPAWQSCKYNSACAQNGVILPLKELSIWFQVIAYIFGGMGEIFTSATAYELFYAEVHPDMRSLSQGINLWSTAYGAFAVGGFNGMFRNWFPTDLNSSQAHLDYVFYIIGVVTLTVAFLWSCIQRSHVYRKDRIDTFMAKHEPGSGIEFEQCRDGVRTKSSALLKISEDAEDQRLKSDESQNESEVSKTVPAVSSNGDGTSNDFMESIHQQGGDIPSEYSGTSDINKA